MAFNLNGFNFNHLVLAASGRPMLANADIISRANLGAQSMHSPDARHVPLPLALMSAVVCARRSEVLSSGARRTRMQMLWSGGLTRSHPDA
ncbi:MAG: hypothetical protein HC838_03270 [Spirulinaceae cyanobacterium RM2_2_10]|nr:hypothetical protein [Spirulinaceae cyanobacterium RM2_2_10]